MEQKKIELNFTPRTIKELEDKAKRSFAEVLQDFSMKSVILFVEKGCRVSEEAAEKKVEEYMSSGGNLLELYNQIMTQLTERGFLGDPKEMEKAKKEALNQ